MLVDRVASVSITWTKITQLAPGYASILRQYTRIKAVVHTGDRVSSLGPQSDLSNYPDSPIRISFQDADLDCYLK